MPKVKSNTLVAVEWLWSNRGKNISWTPSVLAKGNPDPASPKLTDVEAISVFELLKEKELIIPSIHEGQQVFLLHEAKEIEWNNLISELGINRPRKTRTNAELASKTPKTNTASETKLQWWVKTLLGAGGVGVIVVALIALLNRNSGQGNLGVQNSNSGPTFNTVGHSNTVYNSVTTVVANPSDEEKLRSEMKQRIRAVLADVNPESLRAIDSGVQRTNIYMSDLKWRRFERLLEYPEFTNYIVLASYSQVQFGGNNNYFGAGLYDSVRSGNIWRLTVLFKSDLKVP